MRSSIRARVEKNCEYHEELAANYERLAAEATKGKKGAGDALKQTAALHAETAKQLREVLGAEAPPAIEQAVASRTIRRRQLH